MCLMSNDFVFRLRECRKSKDANYCRAMYAMACGYGMDSETSIGNRILQMFVECGCIRSAERIMAKLSYVNERSWTALICAYVDTGHVEHAFDLYHAMRSHGVDPSMYTYMPLLRGCSHSKRAGLGEQLHAEMAKLQSRDLYVNNALIDMYARCGSVSKARDVFEELESRDVVSWTSLISGYAEYGPPEEALRCFELMQGEGISPNDLTIVCVLKACASMQAIDRGREIGEGISLERLRGNVVLANSLVDMYAKCGAPLDAQEAFDKLVARNVVSWNALIQGYVDQGFVGMGLERFGRMCGEAVCPDATSWTSLIAGYAEHGPRHEALNLFQDMLLRKLFIDVVAYSSLLKACGGAGANNRGRELHAEMACKGFDTDLVARNSLISMYARNGYLSEACDVFAKLSDRDVYAWNSMISAYAMNREGSLAMQCFEAMAKQEVEPDEVTFTSLLAACSHARMAVESREYFEAMGARYSIAPDIRHYTSIVDSMARSGGVKAAEQLLLEAVPGCFHDEGMWASLLTSCKMYGEVEVGHRCFGRLVRKNREAAAAYAIMAEIYASAGTQEVASEAEAIGNKTGWR